MRMSMGEEGEEGLLDEEALADEAGRGRVLG